MSLLGTYKVKNKNVLFEDEEHLQSNTVHTGKIES